MKRLKSFVIIGLSFLIVVFLIYFFFGGTQIYNDEDNFLSINRFLIWCLSYIFCFIVGLCFRFYEDGGELEPEEAKNIRAWKAQKSKDKGVYKEKITLVGFGWASIGFLQYINTNKYDVHLISDNLLFLYTPLLAQNVNKNRNLEIHANHIIKNLRIIKSK